MFLKLVDKLAGGSIPSPSTALNYPSPPSTATHSSGRRAGRPAPTTTAWYDADVVRWPYLATDHPPGVPHCWPPASRHEEEART
jgi:hypothetical protein